MKVMRNNVLVVPEIDKQTESGIILKHEDSPEPIRGKIEGIGDKVESLRQGDTVLFEKFAGTPIHYDGKDHIIMSENDVIAILD